VELVIRNYWWPGVTSDIRRYVEGCDLCQRMKNRTEKVARKLRLSEVPEKLWTYLMVDYKVTSSSWEGCNPSSL